MFPQNDPILQEAIPHVNQLNALTAPMSTTLLTTPIYFRSAQAHCSAIREDGKRISFVNNHAKVDVKEDVDYLRRIIASSRNSSFSEVTTKEGIETADAALDPVGATERRIRAKVMEELKAAGVLHDVGTETAAKIADVAAANASQAVLAGVDAASQARKKLEALRAGAGHVSEASVAPLSGIQVAQLNPVSTSDIAGAAASSTSTTAATVSQ